MSKADIEGLAGCLSHPGADPADTGASYVPKQPSAIPYLYFGNKLSAFYTGRATKVLDRSIPPLRIRDNGNRSFGETMNYRVRLLYGHLAAICVALCSSHQADAADPYVVAPPNIAKCELPAVQTPSGSSSLWYPSDECGVFYVAPPSRIRATVAGVSAPISKEECDGIAESIKAQLLVRSAKAEFVKQLANHELTSAQTLQRDAEITLASKYAEEALSDDYKTYGGKSAIRIDQDWESELKSYASVNKEYKQIYPLPTAAGLLTFEEKRTSDELQIYGAFKNAEKSPFLAYTVSGVSPLEADSPLADPAKLPIFYPIARAARAGLQTVQFGGGGALTASVTYNRVGYCRSRLEGDSPAATLTPSINYNFALKTSGSYTVKVNVDYFVRTLKSLAKETTGTAYASAVAEDFFTQRSGSTIDVVLDNDLKSSLSPTQQDGLTQTLLVDAANQFLLAAVGDVAKRKEITMPDVNAVSPFKVVTAFRRVCNRSGGFLGIGASEHCFDQAYNVQELQDTSQYQKAEARVRDVFNGSSDTRTRSYVLVPFQASLATP